MKRKFIASVIASFTIILLFSSCTRIDTTDIGNGVIPVVDNVHTFEMVRDVMTDNKIFTNDDTRMLTGEEHGIGIIENDIEFGKTTATSYISLSPTVFNSFPFVKKDTVMIDSVILSLGYNSTFGDSNSIQQIEVREIDRFSGFEDSLYLLNNPDFLVTPVLLGNSTVNFLTLNDTVIYKNGKDTIRTSSELRIALDTLWARQFVNFDVTNAYKSDSEFKKFFKGFEIRASEASPSKNALFYYDPADNSQTRLTFYCRVQNNGRTDTIAPFFTHSLDPQANIVKRIPSNGYLANVTNSIDDDEKLYIQSTPGSYAEVKMPFLDTQSNILIHRAELIIEKHPSQEDYYRPPSILFIDAISSTGDSAFTIRNDFLPVSTSPGYDLGLIGGVYKNDRYVFNLTRYVQSIITKKFPNYTLKVYAPFTTQPYVTLPNSDSAPERGGYILNTPVAAGRIVVYGGGNTDQNKKMRMRIIYSTL